MINIRIGPPKGISKIVGILNKLTGGAVDVAVNAFMAAVFPFLKNYPPQNKITRAQAYPQEITISYGPHMGKQVQGYFSSKQYYWVLLNVSAPYVRTNKTKDSFVMVKSSGGVGYIKNTHPPSKYSMGDSQANLNKLVGWETARAIIRANRATGIRAAFRAILAWMGWK